jgi:hypothetical protein
MKPHAKTIIASFGLLALTGTVVVTLPGAATTALADSNTVSSPVTLAMTMAGLAGRPCENGTLGTAAGQCNTWNIGRYIRASDSLLLRARAEIQNPGSLGSPAGNEAKFYLTGTTLGLGVGSIADVGNPGSQAISGGGPHGSEIVHCIFSGDPLIDDPKVVNVSSVSLRVSDYDITKADLAITLHTVDGQQHVFAPSVIEPLLVYVSNKVYDLNLAALPGAAALPAVRRLDIRSGWFNPVTNKLSGGHFWLSRLTFALSDVSFSPQDDTGIQYD